MWPRGRVLESGLVRQLRKLVPSSHGLQASIASISVKDSALHDYGLGLILLVVMQFLTAQALTVVSFFCS